MACCTSTSKFSRVVDDELLAKLKLVEEKRIRVRKCLSTSMDVEIAYQTFGAPADPCVLLIMGLNGQCVVWDDELCDMIASRGFYVVRFDNRDIGLSTKMEGKPTPSFFRLMAFPVWMKTAYSLRDMADDAAALLDSLSIHRAHIVGTSMGGMIAQLVGIHHADKCLSLTLMMTHSGSSDVAQPTFAAKKSFFGAPKSRSPSDIAEFQTTWCKIHTGNMKVDDKRMYTRQLHSYQRSTFDGSLRQAAAILTAESRAEALKKVNIPTLVLHGGADILVPVKNGHQIASLIPNAKLVVYPDMGHILLPDSFEGIVNELAELAARATTGESKQL